MARAGRSIELLLLLAVAAMYCPQSAARAVEFIEQHCRWTKAPVAGQPIRLEPWARTVVEKVFGTLRDDGSGKRQISKALVFIPRKNAKSEGLAAPIGLKLLFADGEEGAEIYSCAKDREQAGITFAMARRMVELDPALSRRAHIVESKKLIAFPRMNSFWRALPRDGLAAQGYNPHCGIFDELHTQPDERMYEAMDMGSGTRAQPLFFEISTAGEDPAGLCRKEVEYAKQVDAGVLEDKAFYSFLSYIRPEENWKDEAVWRRVNPASFRSMDEIRAKFRRAIVDKRREIGFRMYYLNEFVEESVASWLNLDAWDRCSLPVDESTLKGRPCWSGLDLSSTTDLTALVHAFPLDDGSVALVPRFFLPEEAMLNRSDRDRAQYHKWIEDGLIIPTEGNVIDYDVVKETLLRDAEKFEIREVAFDPYQALKLVTELTKEGVNCVAHRQGTVSMSPPMKECERLILAGKMRHGGNKVLRWMFVNTAVKEDSGGNIKPIKAFKHARIDGIVAGIMATGRATLAEGDGPSVYTTEGAMIL